MTRRTKEHLKRRWEIDIKVNVCVKSFDNVSKIYMASGRVILIFFFFVLLFLEKSFKD